MSPSNELLQGTLDMLILRTLQLGALHGWAIAQRIQQISNEVLQVQQARCIRRCTVWNIAASFPPTGVLRKIIAKRSTTASRLPGRNSSQASWTVGSASALQSLLSYGRHR